MGLGRSPTPRLASIVLAVCLSSPSGGFLQATDAVDKAIDKGIEYLLGEIKGHQVPERGPGQVALETYALVVAGVSVEHPLIEKNFSYLSKQMRRSKHTYSLACYLFALDAAISQIEHDLLILEPKNVRARFMDDPRIGKRYRPHVVKATNALVDLQNDVGAWRYGPTGDDFDNSNVQFAVLGLGIGAKRRVAIDRGVWRGVVDHFLKWQQASNKEVEGRITLSPPGEGMRDRVKLIAKDGEKRRKKKGRKKGKDREGGNGKRGGTTVVPDDPENPEIGTENIKVYDRGWAYSKDKSYRWNMTCAGLSSLLLARSNLVGQLPPDLQANLNKAIRDGYGRLMAHWEPTKSYYGIYSLEKVADIGGVKLFAGHDWYEEVSNHLVGNQKQDGSWPGGGSHGETSRVASSFALLVLNRATSLLTMNPADRIMISGRGGGINDPNDRSWVYVPDLDVTMHYPTLLRTIRLRPSVKLIKFLRNIVDNYRLEWKGELIPEMAKVRDAIPRKAARKVIQEYLTEITGYKYDEWEKYLQWHRRWERVIYYGSEQKVERIPELITYYKKTNKSLILKKTIIWSLVQCKAREAIPLFLDDLDHKDEQVRLAAYGAFKDFFIEYPPRFDAGGSSKVRRVQVGKIRKWYERQQRS